MPPLPILLGAIALMLVLLAGGVWIAFAVGVAGVVAMWPTMGVRTLTLIGLQSWDTTTSFVLVAIPLFVFMGEVISGAGLIERLYRGISRLIDGLPGRLVQTNLFACSIFAACSGSALASAATMGRVAYREQVVKRGYQPQLVLGSVAAGGTLGILIPPSIFFVVYASIADQSVGRLFLGGVVPGIVVSLSFMLYTAVRCARDPGLTPRGADEPTPTLRERVLGLLEIWPFLLLIVAVLGSLYGGVATPTEAAGVGAAAALAIAAGYRTLTWAGLRTACLGTVKTSSMLFFIIISAKLMAIALAYYGVPVAMKQFATSLGSPYLLLLIIALAYLVLGTVFEDFSLMIIMLPFILPMVQAAGFDLVWFGVFMTVLLEAGLLTPPVGLNLFVIQGVTGASLGQVARGSVPFLLILLGAGVLLVLFPGLALWLPRLVM
ncbi:MAG: TRAP transporter large permease subunit [Candidatus Rokuibacteriota bacterium]|nr:MAG: TRAP transporter large permease subunit [Candidatus Rokubacteria bacterium]